MLRLLPDCRPKPFEHLKWQLPQSYHWIENGFTTPSSLPSPQGEGESTADSRKTARLSLPGSYPKSKDWLQLFLLLGEKVRMRADVAIAHLDPIRTPGK
jgi:hypothetical protein